MAGSSFIMKSVIIIINNKNVMGLLQFGWTLSVALAVQLAVEVPQLGLEVPAVGGGGARPVPGGARRGGGGGGPGRSRAPHARAPDARAPTSTASHGRDVAHDLLLEQAATIPTINH